MSQKTLQILETLPDGPSDIDGGDDDSSGSSGAEDSDDDSEMCTMFQGGEGVDASSWFNTPAKITEVQIYATCLTVGVRAALRIGRLITCKCDFIFARP